MVDAHPAKPPAAEAAAQGKVAPPMSWQMRLSLPAIGYIIDATTRANGTIKRCLLSLLDLGVPTSATPRHSIASRDVTLEATPRHAHLFHPAGLHPTAPIPVIVFFHGGGFAFLSVASAAYDAICAASAGTLQWPFSPSSTTASRPLLTEDDLD